MAERPAVTVKIDNDAAAPPQSGLDQADVVYEEVVEGGITRYLAIFQSQDADPVGPVRSVRETDADIVRPIGGLFAYSGGIPPFVSLIDSAGITDVGADDDGGAYYRSNERNAPDNLYTSTTVLRQRTPAGAGPPPPLFDYVGTHETFSEPGEKAVSQVTVTMSGATVATWSYDATAKQWDRSTNGHPQTGRSGHGAFSGSARCIYQHHRRNGPLPEHRVHRPSREPGARCQHRGVGTGGDPVRRRVGRCHLVQTRALRHHHVSSLGWFTYPPAAGYDVGNAGARRSSDYLELRTAPSHWQGMRT